MLTRDKVFRKLKEAGLRRNTHDWKDYEMGKSMLTDGKYMTTTQREMIVRWIAEYFGG